MNFNIFKKRPKLPCLNCLVLSRCKARLNGKHILDLVSVINNCSLITKYIKKTTGFSRSIYFDEKNLVTTVKYLTKNIERDPNFSYDNAFSIVQTLTNFFNDTLRISDMLRLFNEKKIKFNTNGIKLGDIRPLPPPYRRGWF